MKRHHSTKELKPTSHRKCMMCCFSAVDYMLGAMGARLKSMKLLKFNQGENRLIILLFTSLFPWTHWRGGAQETSKKIRKWKESTSTSGCSKDQQPNHKPFSLPNHLLMQTTTQNDPAWLQAKATCYCTQEVMATGEKQAPATCWTRSQIITCTLHTVASTSLCETCFPTPDKTSFMV